MLKVCVALCVILTVSTLSAQSRLQLGIGLRADHFSYEENFTNDRDEPARLSGSTWTVPVVTADLKYTIDTEWSVPLALQVRAAYPLLRVSGTEQAYFTTNKIEYISQRNDVEHSLQCVQGVLELHTSKAVSPFVEVERSLFQSKRSNLLVARDTNGLSTTGEEPWEEFIYSTHLGGGIRGVLSDIGEGLGYELSYLSPLSIFVSNTHDDRDGNGGAFGQDATGFQLNGEAWFANRVTERTSVIATLGAHYRYWSGATLTRERIGETLIKKWPKNTTVLLSLGLAISVRL